MGDMAEEPWNKTDIPFPSAVSVYRVPFDQATDAVLQCVVAESERFLALLCSEVLQTEIRVVYEVLYVLRNSLSAQRHFRALRQLEQCINRVKEMKLRDAVQDLWEACPKQAQRTIGLECGECEVPSQAFLEWVCVKILGGACLLTRLLDHCSRAFILSRRHLQTGEFLIVNQLLISMLSRQWVLFRGLLRALPPLYQHTHTLLQQVARVRPLGALGGWTLPGELHGVLGPSGAALLDVGRLKRATSSSRAPSTSSSRASTSSSSRASLLSRLFGERRERRARVGVQEAKRLQEDLGSLVLQRPAHITRMGAELDIKTLLIGNGAANTQMTPNQKQFTCRDPAVIGQKRKFVTLLGSASSFSDLAVLLQEVMRWCRDRKLTRERRSLAFMCVQCHRMVSMEADGMSVKRRLRRFQRTARQVLMLRKWRSPRPCNSLTRLWRQRLSLRTFFRTAHRTFWNHRGTFTQRGRTSKAGSRTFRTVASKRTVLPQRSVAPGSVALSHDPAEKEGRGNDVTSGPAEGMKPRKANPQNPAEDEDDIDDIFASIGF